MIKYIVIWVLLVSVNCPNPVSVDEFGRGSIIQKMTICKTTRIDTLTKEFSEKDEAFSFYERAKNQPILSKYRDVILSAKIDSVKIK